MAKYRSNILVPIVMIGLTAGAYFTGRLTAPAPTEIIMVNTKDDLKDVKKIGYFEFNKYEQVFMTPKTGIGLEKIIGINSSTTELTDKERVTARLTTIPVYTRRTPRPEPVEEKKEEKKTDAKAAYIDPQPLIQASEQRLCGQIKESEARLEQHITDKNVLYNNRADELDRRFTCVENLVKERLPNNQTPQLNAPEQLPTPQPNPTQELTPPPVPTPTNINSRPMVPIIPSPESSVR